MNEPGPTRPLGELDLLKPIQGLSSLLESTVLSHLTLTCNCITILKVKMNAHGTNGRMFKVPISSMGILNICNRWILLRKILIYLVGRKCHFHGLFRC